MTDKDDGYATRRTTVGGSASEVDTVEDLPSPPQPDPAGAPGSGVSPAASGAGAARRGLAVSVLTAVAGGGLGFFATGRVWAVHTVVRPAPLAPQIVHTTGRELASWAAAAALVGLAGGLALLATRGRFRMVVAALLALAGVGVAAGGVRGLVVGSGGETTLLWPLICVVAGGLVLSAGVIALARGRRWSAMGSRYDAPSSRPAAASVAGPDAPPAALWDALDNGDDPTAR